MPVWIPQYKILYVVFDMKKGKAMRAGTILAYNFEKAEDMAH